METVQEERKGMSRRDFLLVSAAALGTSVLYHGPAGATGERPGSGFAESSCKRDGKMKDRVLIAYASRCGSTGGVAEVMGQTLCGMGAAVDVRLMGNVDDLSPYRAVIVGSAIRMGKWLPEADAFVKKHRDLLGQLRTAYFVVCVTMKDDTPENRSKVLAYLDPVRKEAPNIRPAAIGLFPGAVNFGELSFIYRSMLKAKGVPEGDFRDWGAIRAWTAGAGPALLDT